MASPRAACRPWPDVQGSGRIGGDELDVDLEPLAQVAASVVGPLGEDASVHAGELVTGQPEVDEAGTGDLGLLDQIR